MKAWVKDLKVEGQKSTVLSLCFLGLFGAITGCKENVEIIPSFSEPVYSKQYREQSAITIVTLSETNISTSGKIQLMIEVHTSKSEAINFPDIRYSISPLTVADGYTEPWQTLPNGHTLLRRVWTLLPALPGPYELPALEITAGDILFETEPVSIQVSSLLPEGLEAFQIKDIAATASLLPEEEKKHQATVIILSSLAGLVVLVFLIRKLLVKKPVIEMPCHEKAMAAMNDLPDHPTERVHALIRIFLVYIQARFEIPTAGRTLVEIRSILEDHADLPDLLPFLETSEQIRFSNRIPDGFAEETEQFVRHFIESTMEVPPCD